MTKPRNPLTPAGRPPRPKRKTQRPGGLKFLSAPTVYTTGPGAPPKGFVHGGTSSPEWYVFWGLEKILGKPEAGNWQYQGNALGGRHAPGGAVPDFIVYDRKPALIIRVQGVFFHLEAGQRKTQDDEDQRRALERAGYQVIDVFDSQFMRDISGKTVIKILRDALAGYQWPNPAGFHVLRGY